MLFGRANPVFKDTPLDPALGSIFRTLPFVALIPPEHSPAIRTFGMSRQVHGRDVVCCIPDESNDKKIGVLVLIVFGEPPAPAGLDRIMENGSLSLSERAEGIAREEL